VNFALGDEDHLARLQYPSLGAAPLLGLTETT
jgi:hypothetical protein